MSPVDGDSFRIGGAEVRLVGIDAPEGRQDCERQGRAWACGREATARLERLVAGRALTCTVEQRDQHGRLLSVCRVGETEINRWMVEHGWAVAYGRYVAEETKARNARLGLWSGTFERPRAWRDRTRAGADG